MAGGNICFVAAVVALYILAQAAASGVDYFVSFWTNVEEKRTVTLYNITTNGTHKYYNVDELIATDVCQYIYGGLILALFAFALTRSMLFYKLAMNSSQNLHDSMVRNVLYTTMRFFDMNPSGRILNRFSKDMGAVDELLPKTILDAGQVRTVYQPCSLYSCAFLDHLVDVWISNFGGHNKHIFLNPRGGNRVHFHASQNHLPEVLEEY